MEKTLPSIGPERGWPGRAGSGVVDMGRDYTHLPRVAQFYSSPPDRAGIRKRGWHGEGKLEDNPTTSEAENWNGKVENAQGRICACRGGNPRGLLGDREENEAYCLAVPGSSYAVYFPGPGQVRLKTGESGGTLPQRWYDIDRGNWLPAEETRSAGSLTLKTPGPGQWAVVVRSLNGSLPSLPASALKDGIQSDSQ